MKILSKEKFTMEKNLFIDISIKVAFTIKEVAIPRKIPNIPEIAILSFPELETLGCF